LRVLVGKERFSENHAWSEMPDYWPAGLVGRAVIEVVGQGQLEGRLVDGGPPVDVVVPLWSPLPGRAIRAGSFGLVQQFGVGVDNIDLDAAADEGVWIANMPGLNAVPVAEHAVALLLALARRLPEASKGFEPGRWGEPAGRSLAGTSACIVGAGAIGIRIARRLAAFDVTVTGVRRHPPDSPVPPFAAVYGADRLLDCVADVDSVIISAGHQAGRLPLSAHRYRGDSGRDRDGVGSHPPRRYRGGGLGLRRGDAGCLPDHKHPGGTRSASRPDRRLLHRVLHGIQYPRRDRRTRRGRSGQLDLPRAFAPRHKQALEPKGSGNG